METQNRQWQLCHDSSPTAGGLFFQNINIVTVMPILFLVRVQCNLWLTDLTRHAQTILNVQNIWIFFLSTLLTPVENRLWTHLPTMRMSEVRVHYRTECLAWPGLACVPSQLRFPLSSLLHPLVCDLEINPGLLLWRTFQPLKTSQRRRGARRCRCMCTFLADGNTICIRISSVIAQLI